MALSAREKIIVSPRLTVRQSFRFLGALSGRISVCSVDFSFSFRWAVNRGLFQSFLVVFTIGANGRVYEMKRIVELRLYPTC